MSSTVDSNAMIERMKILAIIAMVLAVGAVVNLLMGSAWPVLDIGIIVVAAWLTYGAFMRSRDPQPETQPKR